MNKFAWISITILAFIFGLGLAFPVASTIKTIDTAMHPGVGSIVYVSQELPDTMNGSIEWVGGRQYTVGEPALVLEDLGNDVFRIRFCSDGTERMFNLHWFVTYRLPGGAPASYANCQ